ncbi:MAG: heme o synthase [Bryobacteraceae bacterium]|nr:heme o synthase [Bryobacteraceae bacterium]
MKDYIALTKPRITWLILMSTGVGFWFGLRDALDWWVLLHAMVGTGLIASGTAALNQWYEREADAKMRRTQDRPLPAGRLTAGRAAAFSIALSIAGFLELGFGANWLTAWLGAFTLATYLFLYTPLKRRTPHSTTIGAVPGAMPPLIGFAASAGELNAQAWVLFAILFLWQFPHFYAIAWLYREDYARAGIRMLPVVEPSGESTARRMVFCSLALVPVTLLPTFLGMTGSLYLAAAIVLGGWFVFATMKIMADRSLVQARNVLLASVIYLPVLYALLVLDRS